jgi:membrane-associated protease RseP (regulator of RpoE activity)
MCLLWRFDEVIILLGVNFGVIAIFALTNSTKPSKATPNIKLPISMFHLLFCNKRLRLSFAELGELLMKFVFAKFAVLVIAMLFLSSCAFSGYAEFYKPTPGIEKNNTAIKFLSEGEKPKLMQSKNLLGDADDLMSEHYVVIGESSFNAESQDDDDLMGLAEQVGATIVLYNWQYSNTKQETIYIPQVQTTNVNVNSFGFPGSGFSNNFGTTSTYGTITTTTNQPISYSVDRYNYHAIFFAPFDKKMKFGVQYQSLSSQMRQAAGRNTGAYARIVYKRTPAYQANIVNGDVIVKFDGKDVVDSDSLDKIIDSTPSGKKVKVSIVRNNEEKAVDVTLD